jgi:hypothetical protein
MRAARSKGTEVSLALLGRVLYIRMGHLPSGNS